MPSCDSLSLSLPPPPQQTQSSRRAGGNTHNSEKKGKEATSVLLSHARHGDSMAYTKVMSRPNTCAHAHKHPHKATLKFPNGQPKAYRVHIYITENCNYTCENNNHNINGGLVASPRMYDICVAAPWLQLAAAAFTIQCQGNHSRARGTSRNIVKVSKPQPLCDQRMSVPASTWLDGSCR